MSDISTLWFDKIDALTKIKDINFRNKKYVTETNVKEFINNGITILPKAIDNDTIDSFLGIIDDNTFLSREDIFSSYGQTIKKINEISVDVPLTKLLDLYVKLDTASHLLCCDAIKEFLEIMFSEKAKLFQSLYFKKGSTQAIHQDPAYVVIDEHPHNLIASWIALEDIKKGSGELVYILGSHTKLVFRYKDNRIHWNVHEDGNELHDHHLHCLEKMAKELTLTQYFPKKGDILFWHAGLVHGGAAIENTELTRKSIVGHYCPTSSNPFYYNFDKNRHLSEINGIDTVSMYYKDN